MRTTDYSRLFACAPLDATAATVTSGARHRYEPQIKAPPGFEHWAEPPPVIPPHRYPKVGTFVDLRGRRLGRMTVVGFLGKINNAGKARWLLKCSCGDYEARSQKAILSSTEPDLCCLHCVHLRKLKRAKMPDVDTWLASKKSETETAE